VKATWQSLLLQANRLKGSERGRRVLDALIQLNESGATGLDQGNKNAATDLFLCMMRNPWDWPAELHSDEKERGAKL
jgi:hypothetical protein